MTTRPPMSAIPHTWIRGTRGTPETWYYLKPKKSTGMRIQVPGADVQPTPSSTGLLTPWDWCRDVVEFEPEAPWRAYIPAYDPQPLLKTGDPRCLWVSPNFASSSHHILQTSTGYRANDDVLVQVTTVSPPLFHFASQLADKRGWTGPAPPSCPELHEVGREFGSQQEALAHLWTYRRPILDALGFIANLFIHLYVRAGLDWESTSLFTTFPPQLKGFLQRHLFSGQRFRGVLIDTARFYPHFTSQPKQWKAILDLMTLHPNYPAPLVVLHTYTGNDTAYQQIFNFRRIPTELGKVGDMTNFLVQTITARHGYSPKTRAVVAKYFREYKSVTYKSEMDGFNVRLIFLDCPVNGRNTDAMEDETWRDDVFSEHVSLDFYSAFDSGQKMSLLQPQPPSPPRRTSELTYPGYIASRPKNKTIYRLQAERAQRAEGVQKTQRGYPETTGILGKRTFDEMSDQPSELRPALATPSGPPRVGSNVPASGPIFAEVVVQNCDEPAATEGSRLTELRTTLDFGCMSMVDDNAAIPSQACLDREFQPTISWTNSQVSILAQLGITLDHSPSDGETRLPPSFPSRAKLEQNFLQLNPTYFSGTCSAWLAETTVIPPSLGRPRRIAAIPRGAMNADFLTNLRVKLPYKTEMILISYLEQFPDAVGLELLGFCISRGLSIFVSWARGTGKKWAMEYREKHGECTEFHEELRPMLLNPKFSNSQACREWLRRVERLCQRPEAKALLFYGGYVARLVVEFAGEQIMEAALEGPSHRFLAHGDRFLLRDVSEWDFRDSEIGADYAMDPLLDEVYGLTEDRSRSFWPPLQHFMEAERWTGIWSEHNEIWFRSIMAMIRDGRMMPQPWSQARGGDALGVGLRGQAPIERKVASLRSEARYLLAKWRQKGIPQLVGSPLETSGELRVSSSPTSCVP